VLSALRSAEAAEPLLSAETRNLHAWLATTHPQLTQLSRQSSLALRADGGPPEPCVTGLPESDPWLALTASLCEIYVSGRVAEHAEWLEQSLCGLRPNGNSVWACEAAFIAMLGLLDAGLPDTVLAWCSALSDAGGCGEERAWEAQLRALHAEAQLRKGSLDEALKAAREALTQISPQAWGTMVGLPLGTLITAATMSGQLEEAARYLAISPAKGTLRSRCGLYYLYARGHHNVATQRTYAGLGDYLACGDLAKALGLDTANLVQWRASAAEAWLRVGNHERARRLIREQLALPGSANDRSRGQALRVLAALSSLQRQPSLLLEAVELLEKAGDQYGQACALADLSTVYSRLGNSRRARSILRRARYLAQACGAALLCDGLFADQEAEETRATDGNKMDQLTETEQRVVNLAVLGYTNRDIAEKLYVTSSTVEQHLTRIYRKLNIKSRRDLPTDLDNTTPLRQSRRVWLPVQPSVTMR
jgi:DNA-binding NarL/FixJ family response regulator